MAKTRAPQSFIHYSSCIVMQSISDHPYMITEQLKNSLRSHSLQIEISGKLSDEQLNIIYENKWFNMFVPVEYGGLQLSLPEGLLLEENLARIDGSLGWTVTLCSGANYFIGFLPEHVRRKLFSDPRVCFSGSGYSSGLAQKHSAGYTVEGRWKYATGIPHATTVTAVCVIHENGKPVVRADGNPLTQAFWFYADETRIIQDWNAMGMIATASHTFEIDNITVPHDRAFTIAPDHAQLPEIIYRYPFLQFAQTTLTVNLTGMVLRFLELCENIFLQKGFSMDELDSARSEFNEARRNFYDITERSWKELNELHAINAETLGQVSAVSMNLAGVCRQVMNRLFPYCGLTAAMRSEEINRIWRNFHTASQHVLFRNL